MLTSGDGGGYCLDRPFAGPDDRNAAFARIPPQGTLSAASD